MKILQWMLARSEFDPAEITTKHLQGRHDQKRHGRRFGNDASPAQLGARVRSAKRRESAKQKPAKSKTMPENNRLPVNLYADKASVQEVIETMGIPGVNTLDDLSTAMHEIFEVGDPISGLKVELVSIEGGNNGLVVSGKIYNQSGESVGYFDRDFTRWAGKIEVEHSLFFIDKAYEGTGFGSRFVRHCQEKYMKYGVSKINLWANLDVGGYAWARMGFDFTDKHKVNELYNKLVGTWVHYYPNASTAPAISNFNHSWDFAAFIGPDGRKIGKEVLLGSTWSAAKILDLGDLGFKVGEVYFDGK